MSRKLVVKFFLLLLASLSFAGAGYISSAQAQVVDLQKMTKVPRHSQMSQKDFEAQTILFTEVPQGDKYLEYSIRLPQGWQKLGENDEVSVIDPVKQNQSEDSSGNPHDILSLRQEKIESDRMKVDETKGGAAKAKKQKEVEEYSTLQGMTHREGLKLRSQIFNTSLLGPVAKYVGPSNLLERSRVEIMAMQLKQGITTRNWFLSYILGRHYTLMGMEQINETRVDAEYVLLEKGVSYVVRTSAISNGPRMVLVSYIVPEASWEKERDLQEMAIDSFQFLAPEALVIDDKDVYGFLDLVKFTYPTTWKLVAPNVYNIETMSAKLLYSTDSKSLDGEIDINLISTEMDTTLIKEVEYVRNNLAERGFVIGKDLEVAGEYSFDKSITFNRVEAYTVKNEERSYIDYEFWLGIMVEDRYYYIVTMLTPGRKADFYTWARNTETFAMVIQSMMPQAPGETLDAAFIKKQEAARKRRDETTDAIETEAGSDDDTVDEEM
ncbi:MAG: hypothetical protein NDJ24_02985 [Alphaproteobacteria bacterium]|nr:hypothetical protein [Alphaproteobacteria bacterium]